MGEKTRVLIVGPDGTGKSTLADGVVSALSVRSRVARWHFRPGVLFAPRSEANSSSSAPHDQAPRSAVSSVAKTALSFVDYLIGGSIRSRGADIVVIERGWHDQIVDPTRYRLAPSARGFVALLGRLVPRADLVLNLHGDIETLWSRKQEIPREELERQLSEWKAWSEQVGHSTLSLDTSLLSEEAAALSAVDALQARGLRWRAVRFTPKRLSMAATSSATVATVATAYRPLRFSARLRHTVASRTHPWLPARSTPGPGPAVGRLIDTLGLPREAAVIDSSARGRKVVTFLNGGAVSHVAKIGHLTDDALRTEADWLTRLDGGSGRLATPRLVWSGECDDRFAVVMEGIKVGSAVVGLQQASDVATLLCLGKLGGEPLVHGDFTPWNLVPFDGDWALLDWEAAESGFRPLEDLAHFVIRSAVLLGRPSVDDVWLSLAAPGSTGRRHLDEVRAEVDVVEVVARVLPHSAEALGQRGRDFARALRSRMGVTP